MSEGQRLKVLNPLRQETAVQILLASHNAAASLILASGTAGYTVGILTEGYEALRYPAPFLHSPVKHHISFGKQFASRIAPPKREALS